MAVKKIQGFHKYVRTDMCESMMDAISLSFEVERRKILYVDYLIIQFQIVQVNTG